MKLIAGILGVGIIGFIAWSLVMPHYDANMVANNDDQENVTGDDSETNTVAKEEGTVVPDGVYVVNTEKSTFNWAAQKPLISGYVNSGSIALQNGSISVAGTEASGSFLVDMKTLSVSDTPNKPGQENMLEGHLKGDKWFNVEAYPTAEFEITKVTPRADSDTTFVYDVTGTLTMHGESGELEFPATIYLNNDNELIATADFEFDRTKWGITFGSGSFFDNLENNVIDDMVSLSFKLVAKEEA